ncbi:MAG TPA: ParB N-terminal domain-containing protein [Candidatus Dormibacteraeota bacterium]|nr:ParB N-terminal domain-containing protein [Candidatus Dormibacteraeota bacterium]
MSEHRPESVAAPRLDGALARWLTPTSESRLERIALDHLHDRPWWTDEPMGDAEFVALRNSIATRGIVEPLLLRHRAAGGLEVVTGSRRLRAARALNMSRVPAIVRELTDREAMLVGAWSTVERRHPSVDELSAVTTRLLQAGLTPEEARVLAGTRPQDAVAAAAGVMSAAAYTPPFLLRPLLRRHRSPSSFAPFLRVSVNALPEVPARYAAEALAVLDTVRPVSIAS